MTRPWTGHRDATYAVRMLDEVRRWSTRKAAVVPLFLALIVSVSGIPDAVAAPPVEKDPNPLVLYHWWGSSSEMAALNALASVFKTKYPGVAEKRTVAPDRGGSLFVILESLMRAGKPPDAIVMQTGYAMWPFVNAGLLAPVDELWAAEGLDKVVPPTLQAMHKFDGHYYSVPIDVQRTNLIWYNKRVLDKHGIDPETLTTWERFFEAATRLRAAGVKTPIQIAAGWTVAETFGNTLAGLGLAGYEDWVNGKIRSATDPRIVQALGILKTYSTYVNRDHANLDWTVALGRVAKGESAFYGMGDWANGDFRAAGLVYGKDYGAIVVPRHEGHVRGDHRLVRAAARNRAAVELEPVVAGLRLAGRPGRLQRPEGRDPRTHGRGHRPVRRVPEMGARQLQGREDLPLLRSGDAADLRAQPRAGPRSAARQRRRAQGRGGPERRHRTVGGVLHARLVPGLRTRRAVETRRSPWTTRISNTASSLGARSITRARA